MARFENIMKNTSEKWISYTEYRTPLVSSSLGVGGVTAPLSFVFLYYSRLLFVSLSRVVIAISHLLVIVNDKETWAKKKKANYDEIKETPSLSTLSKIQLQS